MGIRRGSHAAADALRLHIVARGKIGRGAEHELVERYAARIAWPFQITELVDDARPAPAAPGKTVALDETGETMSSTGLAALLERWRDDGVRETRFLIGGADGLSDADRQLSDKMLSFGRLTWPHLLARAMLAEQLYRATTIVAGHPYHRDG